MQNTIKITLLVSILSANIYGMEEKKCDSSNEEKKLSIIKTLSIEGSVEVNLITEDTEKKLNNLKKNFEEIKKIENFTSKKNPQEISRSIIVKVWNLKKELLKNIENISTNLKNINNLYNQIVFDALLKDDFNYVELRSYIGLFAACLGFYVKLKENLNFITEIRQCLAANSISEENKKNSILLDTIEVLDIFFRNFYAFQLNLKDEIKLINNKNKNDVFSFVGLREIIDGYKELSEGNEIEGPGISGKLNQEIIEKLIQQNKFISIIKRIRNEKSSEEKINFLEDKAKNGHPIFMLELAREYALKNNFEDGLKWYKLGFLKTIESLNFYEHCSQEKLDFLKVILAVSYGNLFAEKCLTEQKKVADLKSFKKFLKFNEEFQDPTWINFFMEQTEGIENNTLKDRNKWPEIKKGIVFEYKKLLENMYNESLDDYITKCVVCEKTNVDTNLKKCAGCSLVRYCSAECQKKDWKNHKPNCVKYEKKLARNLNYDEVD